MINTKKPFGYQYVGNAQLDLLVSAYTKVPLTWIEQDYVPEFNKLYYILEGEGFLKINEQLFSPKPGELYLLPSGKLQSYGTVNENTFGKYWCHFTAKVGNISLFDMVELPPYVRIENSQEMTRLFERLIEYSQSERMSAVLHTKSALLEILAHYIDHSLVNTLRTKPISSFGKMNKVLSYIEEHLSEHLSVEELAQIAHFQPNYFIFQFKNLTGHSPIQYINRMRLEQASNQLVLTELTISEIAAGIGMELSYFSRKFKEHTGYSPSAYRDMLNQTSHA